MADIGNPIHYEDLFHSDVETGLNGLIDRVEAVEGSLLSMLKEVKKEASTLNDALSGTSSASKGERDMTSQYASEIEKLHNANERLTKSLEKVTKDLDALRKKKNEDKDDTIDLSKSYSSLSKLIEETGVSVEELLQSERQLAIAKKNGETANNSLSGSYNKLYAQYNLIKNVLNAMGDEMRNNTEIGKAWEAEALRIMDAMKAMQSATGKHTLEVGNYEQAFTKAMNGLSISTQQVLREMPTLANSVSQFFIAISNNVPIFVDNLKRVQKETGSWVKAMQGVLTSVFSWQTLLLVILTILPKVAKAIHDKRKAQEEEAKAQEKATKATKEAESTYRSLSVALHAIEEASRTAITELKVLSSILENTNRSWEDRIDAGKRLKEIFDEELEGFNAEDIAIGKAKKRMSELTQFIYEQAKARASLNEITELTKKYLELEERAQLYESFRYGAKTVKEYSDALDEANRKGQSIRLGVAEQEAVDTYRSIVSEMKGYKNQIDILTDQIRPMFLLDDEDGRRTRETLEKTKDYYWDWRESVAQILEDEAERAIELNNVKYEHSIANMRAELEEQRQAGVLSAQQEKYLTEIIANLEIERQQRRWEIIWEYYNKFWNAIKNQYATEVSDAIEEEDMSISGRYERLLADNANKLIASRERLNSALVEGTYKEAKEEGKEFKNLTIEKLRLEEELQEALLKMRMETGEITADQYAIELAKMQTALAKNISSLDKRRRGKFDIWTLMFGEVKEDGKGNVYKELSEEAQSFVSAFEEAMSSALEYMDEWMDKRIEMAEIAVEAAEKETEAAKTALEYEMEARANGYANNVQLARKEYEEKLRLENEAIAEKERLERLQERINTAQQISSLVTATAELWAAHAGIPLVGKALAAAATAAMWSAFAAAKVTAAQVTATKYGDGMSEYLDYGGSHASGNDIDFGADKNGRRRRVERGEMIGVINKRNVEKYGVSRITDIIQSLNKGTFENKYSTMAQPEAINQMIMRESILRSVGLSRTSSIVESLSRSTFDDKYGLAFRGIEGESADLTAVERGIGRLIEQGEEKVVTTPYGRIEYRGNNKRIIRNS